MPIPGYVFKDGGPIPDCDLKEPRSQEVGLYVNMETGNPSSTSNSSILLPVRLRRTLPVIVMLSQRPTMKCAEQCRWTIKKARSETWAGASIPRMSLRLWLEGCPMRSYGRLSEDSISKCIMSRLPRTLCWEAWISTSWMKMNSLQINFAAMLKDYT